MARRAPGSGQKGTSVSKMDSLPSVGNLASEIRSQGGGGRGSWDLQGVRA